MIFVGDRCPMSNGFNSRINDLYNELHNRVEFLVINSNANETIEDVGAHARAMEYDFPVYKDVRNTAADLFGAQFTPEAFVVDRSGTIAYQGYIEDAPNPARVKHRALREAIQALLEGKSVPVPRTHGLGCSIRRPHSN